MQSPFDFHSKEMARRGLAGTSPGLGPPRLGTCRPIIAIFFLAASFVCSAQNTSALPSSIAWNHQTWSTENGLPQNSVHQVLQTTDGYLWIATEEGLARFDGINFTVFNQENEPAFASDDICCLAEDLRGSLWIGTADGLLEYSESAFHRFTTADGLPSPEIQSLGAADDGSLLVLTASGSLVRFNGKQFAALPLSPSAMSPATGGRVLLADSTGLFQYKRGGIERMEIPGLSRDMPHESIDGLGEFADHSFWLRTNNSILLFGKASSRTLVAGKDLPGTRIGAAFQDSRGIFWIGTNKGLASLENIADHPRIEPAMDASSILSISEDKEGNLWIGTDVDGLHILRQQKFRTLPELSGHAVTSIMQSSDGAIWAGTNGDGLYRWQQGLARRFTTADGLASNIILALAADAHGTIWAGSPDGLNRIDDRIGNRPIKTLTSADGLPDDFIRSLLCDDDGSLWIGTRHGLAHWQNGHISTLTTAVGLPSDIIGALLKSRSHALWIGTRSGLARLQDGKIAGFTSKNGLSGDTVTALLEDSHGTIWIGTDQHGLSRTTPGGFAPQPGQGLPKTIASILEDNHGYLWLSSNRGITRVSLAALDACRAHPDCDLFLNSYGISDGMPAEEASLAGHPTAWKSESGLLWYATRKGVAIADPDHLPENRVAPAVVIQRFTVDDSDIPLSSAVPAIAPNHNRFAFEYAGLSYVAPSRVRYRYMLEGFDKQWTAAGSRRVAYYTNLAPGHYRFRVQAANNDGVWNNTGAELAFHVETPFYRKLWFLALLLLTCGALLAAVIALIYRLRVRRLQSQFDAVLGERNRIAREIHDTLAQGFAGVSMQLELTSQLLERSNLTAAREQINRTRAFVREGLAEARRTIWELRATAAQDTLPVRLTRLAEEAATDSRRVEVNIGGIYRPLSESVEGEVLRIAQEALVNIDRHARASRVAVALRYDGGRLRLSVADDGRGFNVSDSSPRETGHFGLQGMRERAAQIGGRLTIESSPGKGATVTLDAPLTEGGR